MKVVEHLPAIILIVLVVVVIIIAVYPKAWPLVNSILGLNATIILSPVERMRDSADIFFENYKDCVKFDDNNCKCVFDLKLEKGYAIRLLKLEGGNLRIQLMKTGGLFRKSELSKIAGDIKQDIYPCVYFVIDDFKKISNSIDIVSESKLIISGREYKLPEKLTLYKSGEDVCVVSLKEIESIENLRKCGEEKKEISEVEKAEEIEEVPIIHIRYAGYTVVNYRFNKDENSWEYDDWLSWKSVDKEMSFSVSEDYKIISRALRDKNEMQGYEYFRRLSGPNLKRKEGIPGVEKAEEIEEKEDESIHKKKLFFDTNSRVI